MASGYTMDGWGGIHNWGSAPAMTGMPYWNGWDIARGMAIHKNGSGQPDGGWTLDGWGGIHNWGLAPALSGAAYWPGWDIARGMAVLLKLDLVGDIGRGKARLKDEDFVLGQKMRQGVLRVSQIDRLRKKGG